MAVKLTFDEVELACRLVPHFEDKRDLTILHPWQEFARIGRRTRHARLVRLEYAQIEVGKLGSILLRRGPKWAFDVQDHARIQRDRAVVERLEIGAWLRSWFRPKAAQRKLGKLKCRIPQSRSGVLVSKDGSNVVPLRRVEYEP